MRGADATSSVCRDDPVERLKKSRRAIATRGGCRSPACMDFALTTRQSWHRLKAPRPFWRGGRAGWSYPCERRRLRRRCGEFARRLPRKPAPDFFAHGRTCCDMTVGPLSRSFLGFEPLNRRKRASSAGAFAVGICCIGTDESGFQRWSRPDDVRVSPCTDLVVRHSRHSGMSSQIEPQNQAVTIGLQLKRSFAGASRRFWSSINQPLLDAPQHNHSVCVCTLRVILDAPTVGRLGKLLLVYHNE